MNEHNERLFQFFACYFHQDWNLDDPSWQDVVKRFVRDTGEEEARGVGNDINELLNRVQSDDRLAQVLEELGCYYWAGSPSELRGWLENLSAALQAC